MSEGRNPILVKIYAIVGIVIILICTIFVLSLIWDIWNPPFFRVKPVQDNPKIAQMKALSKGLVKDNFTIAYRGPEKLSQKDSFHMVQPLSFNDNVSLCVTCHGLLPHNYNINMRAFLNKHSGYLACETCHIKGEGKASFGWYNAKNGQVVTRATILGKLVYPDYKIGIFYGGLPARYDQAPLKAAALNLLKNAANLSAETRKERIKPYHNGLRTPDQAVKCIACHDSKNAAQSFIPLADLGYPQGRINIIENSEIIGLLMKYKEFYLPTFLRGDNNPSADNATDKNIPYDDVDVAP